MARVVRDDGVGAQRRSDAAFQPRPLVASSGGGRLARLFGLPRPGPLRLTRTNTQIRGVMNHLSSCCAPGGTMDKINWQKEKEFTFISFVLMNLPLFLLFFKTTKL